VRLAALGGKRDLFTALLQARRTLLVQLSNALRACHAFAVIW
jgi:hypothetical protein